MNQAKAQQILELLSWSQTMNQAAALLAALLIATVLSGQTLTTLASFNQTNGINPDTAVFQATNGNYYGTTASGGSADDGTIFQISAGTLTTLHSFQGTDGSNPYLSQLTQATDGNLYGTTESGGAHAGGTAYKTTTSGTFTSLYSFCALSGCADGQNPAAGLLQASDGNLYGVTEYGGSHTCTGVCGGTVFKLTTGGTLTTLYSFCALTACADGSVPQGTLIQGTDGNLYGTTEYGGSYNQGTVFKITTSGTFTSLYSFCALSSCADGATPTAGVIQATDGNLYGTTEYGGNAGEGTIFKITTGGTLTTLHNLQGSASEGGQPTGRLNQDTDGNLYGTTLYYGAANDGTVFKITTSGTFTNLYSFCALSACTDGANPIAPLIQATDGNLKGATQEGGSGGQGTVFSITP